jgi:hypothetical protein
LPWRPFPPLDKDGFHHIANSTTDFDIRERSDASLFVYAKQTGGKRGEVVWAKYGIEISLELSDFEKLLASAAPSAFRDDPVTALVDEDSLPDLVLTPAGTDT